MEKLSTEITTLLNKMQEVSEDYADLKDILLDDNSVELFEDSMIGDFLYAAYQMYETHWLLIRWRIILNEELFLEAMQ